MEKQLNQNQLGIYSLPGLNNWSSNLDKNLSFETYVIGKFNTLCVESCKKIMDDYFTRSLFIYGVPGSGKTHLLNAMGNEFESNNPDKKVVYLNCLYLLPNYRKFVDLTHLYVADFLIIDNIEFLEYQKSEQIKIKNIFDHFWHAGKKILMASNRLPNNLLGCQISLISRFKWGLIMEIDQVDYISKFSIFNMLKRDRLKSLTHRQIKLILKHFVSDVRKLKAVVENLCVYDECQLTTYEINKVISNYFVNRKKLLKTADVKRFVEEYFYMEPGQIDIKTRKSEILIPRQIAMYFSKILTKDSLSNIGNQLGGKDHATVLNAHKRISNLYETKDKRIVKYVDEIEENIKKDA